MADSGAGEALQQSGTAMKRRGILAAAGAVVAGIAMKQASQPVGAVSVPLNVDEVNNGTMRTFLVTDINGNPPLVVFNGTGPFSIGQADAIQGITRKNVALAAGVQGRNQAPSGPGIGVLGTTSSTDGTGVYGSAGLTTVAPPSGVGVFGRGPMAGIQGTSTTNTGVVGSGPTGVNGNTDAVGGYGGFFTTIASQSTAVGGQIFGTTSGAAAFVGAAGPDNFAAFFTGTVIVNGSLFVSGGAKSAAVKHPRTNDYRALYCVESPESWFEDVGEGKVMNGKAEVTLDPDFAALIHADQYHVFLTPYDGLGALRAALRTAAGFAVEEIGGSGSGTFSYRVVGKRSDLKLDRLAKVTMPNLKLASEPPKVPDGLASPPVPDVSPKSVPPSRPAVPAAGAQGNAGNPTAQPPAVQPIPQPRSG